MIRTLTLILALIATPAHAGVKDVAANVTGLFLQIMIHESGHAAMAAGLGWKVDEFKPYPHICGGRLVGGCVQTSTDLPEFDADGRMNRQRLSESRRIAAAGTTASSVSVLAFSPLQRVFRPSGFAGLTLNHMLIYQQYDWLFYTVTDSLSSFQGDWYAVAQSLDVPVYYFVAPAALNFWLLKIYREHFIRRSTPVTPPKVQTPITTHIEPSAPVLVPRVAYLPGNEPGTRTLAMVVDFAMELP